VIDLPNDQNDRTITQTYDAATNRLEKRRDHKTSDEDDDDDEIQMYWYNDLGDLHCVTSKERSSFNCANPATTQQANERRQMYAWDALERLISTRTFNPTGSGAVVVRATYEYDGLDRPVQTRECHTQGDCAPLKSWWIEGRQTEMAYVGSSSLVGKETITGQTHQSKLKEYSYDPGGGRNAVEVTNTSDQVSNYTYGYDAHGSATLLLKRDGDVQASYGYDPYGGEDEKLTKELKQGSDWEKTPATDPLNAYRYTGKREDSGSGMIDMGARRFNPDTARFMSSDFFTGALADIALSTDPLTQNRFGFAGANPVTYVEVDGHGAQNPNGNDKKSAVDRVKNIAKKRKEDLKNDHRSPDTRDATDPPPAAPPPPSEPLDGASLIWNPYWNGAQDCGLPNGMTMPCEEKWELEANRRRPYVHGICLQGAAGIAVGFQASLCVLWSQQGWGGAVTAGWGPQSPYVGVGPALLTSTARAPREVGGRSTYVGGSAGIPGGSLSADVAVSSCGARRLASTQIGYRGVSFPGNDFHAGAARTYVLASGPGC
jgi:RHS repeat-associated protein